MARISGTKTHDVLVGTAQADVMNANWSAGDDDLYGGLGNDRYLVNSRGDVVHEEADAGIDHVYARVSYALSDNVEYLTLGGTAFDGRGNALDNQLTGNAHANRLTGLDGNDLLQGLAGNDLLSGGQGDDRLDGGTGADRMVGGHGNDTYVVDSAGDRIVEELTPYDPDNVDDYYQQQDKAIASLSYSLRHVDWVEDLDLVGRARTGTGNALDNTLTGNRQANTLTGLDGNDTLVGGGRNDVLRGGAGVDKLDGGTGGDTMVGGSDSDEYTVDSLRDKVIEAAGEAGGRDQVTTSVSLPLLYDNVEGLVLTGAADRGTGNGLDNWIYGNALADTISGGAGNDYLVGDVNHDRIYGGAGDDVLVGGSEQYQYDDAADRLSGGAGHDTFVLAEFYPGMPVDRVLDFNVADDRIQLPAYNSYNLIDPAVIAVDGSLRPQFFHLGAGATGQGTGAAGLYVDTTTGGLWYDPTGGTAGDSVLFMHVGTGVAPAITAADFVFA